jgi:hypothetical protein
MVTSEQHVTVSDPFVLMQQLHQRHPFHRSGSDRRRQTIVGLFRVQTPTFHASTIIGSGVTLVTEPAIARCCAATNAEQASGNPPLPRSTFAELRHPRNVSATTHEINMTSQSRDKMRSLSVRGWRVVRGFSERVPDCTPMKRRLAKSGGKVVVCRPSRLRRAADGRLDRNSRERESHLFCFYSNYRLNSRVGQH